MEIKITTDPAEAVEALSTARPPEGCELSLVDVVRYSSSVSDGVMVVANIGAGIAINLFSSWLYDWLKQNHVSKVMINREEVQIEISSITAAIETKEVIRPFEQVSELLIANGGYLLSTIENADRQSQEILDGRAATLPSHNANESALRLLSDVEKRIEDVMLIYDWCLKAIGNAPRYHRDA